MDGLCAACGAACNALAEGGEVELIRDADPDGIRLLFSGWLAEGHCPVCDALLGVDLTVVCISDDPPAIDVSRASRVGDVAPGALLSRVGVRDGRAGLITIHGTLEDLVDTVAGRLKARYELLNPAAYAMLERRLMEYLREHWREYTDEVFTAAIMPLLVQVPGVQLGFVNAASLSADKIARQFGDIQAYVWLALCDSWFSDGTHSESLQGDLDRYVLRGGVLQGAVETFDGFADRLQQVMFHSRYVLEAVRAAAYSHIGQPNPAARQWARAMVSLEFDSRYEIDQVSPKLRLMRVSQDMARRTIGYADAWWAISMLADEVDIGPTEIGILQDIAAFAGHPGLMSRLLATMTAELDVPDMLRAVDVGRETVGEDIDEAVGFVAMMDGALLRDGRTDELEQLADGLLERFTSDDARAAVETWFGRRLKELRQPQRFLARIGKDQQPWELGLQPERRASLLLERSNALRLTGASEAALEAAYQALNTFPPEADNDHQQIAAINVAILIRETGAPDAAAAILAGLAASGSARVRLAALSSLATTLTLAHRASEAVAVVKRALALADGPRADEAPGLWAVLAMLQAAEGRPAEAMEAIEHTQGAADDPLVVLPTAAALLNVIVQAAGPVDRAQVEAVGSRLFAVHQGAMRRGDADVACKAARALANLHDSLEMGDAEARWEEARVTAQAFGAPPDPEALLHLAAYAYGRRDTAAARAFLGQVPDSLRHDFHKVQDLAAVASGTSRLRYAAMRLTGMVLAAKDAGGDVDWGDVRQVADIGRSAIARAAADTPDEADYGWPDDGRVAALMTTTRSVGVVEWLRTEYHYRCLLTVIRPGPAIASRWLVAPAISLEELAAELPGIIRGWRRNRHGDPLADQRWQELVGWWQAELSSELAEGDHVVVLEHPDFLGLPWHVACGERWTCSYNRGWFALLRPCTDNPVRRLGVIRVPKYSDADQLRAALLSSADRTRAFAAHHGLEYASVEDVDADANAVKSLLERVDAVKLLCHGYIDALSGEVAFMVAHNRVLPLRDSIASGSIEGRRHRLGWAILQNLEDAPEVVFSLACSSGVAHAAGLGERLGHFTAFSRVGSRSLIAPRWEVPARDVAPVLDATLEGWLTQGGELARALQQACTNAAKSLPPRYAWALALEGDWR
jgi:hypothetical protein